MATKEDIKKAILDNIKNENSDNLFSILGIQNKELIHSRFIAYLLGNNGEVYSGNNDTDYLDIKHNHGLEFLNEFLTTFYTTPRFKSKLKEEEIYIYNETPKVYIEYEDDDLVGRIDILIKFDSYWIAIENKIYAGDQELQLERYHTFLTKKVNKNFDLIYLTLDGHEPSKSSKGNLKDDAYEIISYKDTIINWLVKCIQKHDLEQPIKSYIYNYLCIVSSISENYIKAKSEGEKLEKDWNLNDLENKNDVDFLKKFIYPYIIKKYIENNTALFESSNILFGKKDCFYTEENIFYIWVYEENRIEYDLYFEYTADGNVIYFPIKIDKTSNKWYWGKDKEDWLNWGSRNTRQCWKQDKNEGVPLKDFMNMLREVNIVLEKDIKDMRKYIKLSKSDK